MSPKELDEIEKRTQDARILDHEDREQTKLNADFFIHALDDIPKMVAYIRQLEDSRFDMLDTLTQSELKAVIKVQHQLILANYGK